MIMVLGIAATVVWLKVLQSDANLTAETACNPPQADASSTQTKQAAGGKGQAKAAKPTEPGTALTFDALDQVRPAPPGKALVHVLNASTKQGMATQVTESLRALGFAKIAPPANDQLYSSGHLHCRGQIRFGEQGTATARTLSLLEPCAELVRDDRKNATVDLALGEEFTTLRPSKEAREILGQLSTWAAQHPEAKGGLQAKDGSTPEIDEKLLAGARDVIC